MSEVKLISRDQQEFTLSNEAAVLSPMLKGMISRKFAEGQEHEIRLTEISSEALRLVVNYLEYLQKYQDCAEDEDIPEFEVPTEMSLELLLAADYLNI
ncbi:LAMI_0A01420g1_1 [Lachancea mirantina]|uniref:Elongin-C n=1 Tax=Lachancea mirantina TaxID=1230905 RepID=A0A1G4ILV6_9SACH|nr:LAMI_0A01420g1_1 [Lachancea mirantina]